MSFKSKFLNIITFGHINRKAKKRIIETKNKNNYFKQHTIELPNIDQLLNALGGKDNIWSITNTISSITFTVYDSKKINFNELKYISKKGIINSNNSITLLIGDCAEKIKQLLTE